MPTHLQTDLVDNPSSSQAGHPSLTVSAANRGVLIRRIRHTWKRTRKFVQCLALQTFRSSRKNRPARIGRIFAHRHDYNNSRTAQPSETTR